jgi:acid phosphatase (class A)
MRAIIRRTAPIICAITMIGAAPAAAPERYLAGPGIDLLRFLPPPPAPGSSLEDRDRAMFRAGRPAVDSARWQMATGDVDEGTAAMLSDYSEAIGMPLTMQRYPALTRLLIAMRPDVAAAVNAVKPVYARKRPFLRDDGPVCEDKVQLSHSFDYPSGHTSWGTTVALVLAELRPDRAAAILQRGYEYGNSRVICGAHSVSAVEAGRQAAAAIVAVLHGSARFRADVEAARRELAPAR